MNGFYVGGLGVDENAKDRPGGALWEGPSDVNGGTTYEVHAVGGSFMQDEKTRFDEFLKKLPLTPGYVHSFRVVPFLGEVGRSNYFEGGTVSDKLVLDGAVAACYTTTDRGGDLAGTFEVHPKVVPIYGCRGVEGETGPAERRTRFGLLSLVGTEACGDIFSSTPPEFTWDNGTVRNVWVLMVVVGGAVIFTLVVWQGLRMTYDVWLDPQPAVGVREMVPRFLLAVVLMAGSLAICEVALVLASDLTCVVAQATGMTMWGFLGTTIGEMFVGAGCVDGCLLGELRWNVPERHVGLGDAALFAGLCFGSVHHSYSDSVPDGSVRDVDQDCSPGGLGGVSRLWPLRSTRAMLRVIGRSFG